MPLMEIERRAFLRCAAATALTLLGPTVARTQQGAIRYLNACRLTEGGYAVAEFDPEGVVIRTIPLPDRGHGFALFLSHAATEHNNVANPSR